MPSFPWFPFSPSGPGLPGDPEQPEVQKRKPVFLNWCDKNTMFEIYITRLVLFYINILVNGLLIIMMCLQH